MPELAKAYVQIVPSAEGIQGKLQSTLGGEAESAGLVAGNQFSSSFSKLLLGGTIAVAAGKAAKMVGEAIKTSVMEYADYEQLSGGVETLFKDSAGIVQEYARNAYKTAGLSANDYMETVTSFSAALLQSLGGDTEKAAKKADQAITDMSDNANKMGTSMESIQNAYQGFAKANYTMLDNLKLGYGGTKEEMQRLLEDAEAISGIHYDISSYADIVDAIHVIQTEMGIAGTTAEEAEGTISGSVNAAKSAWHNWVMDLSNDNADMARSTEDMATAMAIAIENIVPKVGNTVVNIVDAIASIPDAVAMAGSKIRYDEFLNENSIETFDDLKAAIEDATASVEDWKTKYDTAVAYGSNPVFQAKQWAEAQQLLDEIVKDTDNLDIIFQAAADGLIEVGAAADMAHLPLNTFLGGLKSYKEGTQEAEKSTEDLADALSEEEQAAKEAHAAIIDIASAAINAKYSGEDLREEYNELSNQLEQLRDDGDAAAVMLAEQQLAILNVLATNQELESSYPGLVDSVGRFGFSVSELSGWLIDNGITAEEWGEQVQSATDGIVNSFQLMNTDLGLSLEDMAANLQANIDATAEWNTNMAALWQAAAESGQAGAMEFVQYMQDLGPAAAAQVEAMAGDLQGTLDTFAPMFADAADAGVTQVYNSIEGANADTAAGDMMQSAVDAAGAVTGWDTMASEDVDQVISGISGGSAGVSGEASGMMQSAQSAAAGVGGWSGIGYNVAAGVAAGIRSGASAVVSAAVSMVTQAAAAARAAAQIASPSKLFKNEIGAFLPAGVAEGIEDNMRPLLESSRNMMQQSLLAADQASSFRSFGQAPLVLGDNETLTLLQTYLPQLARMSVTLQDGAVVGRLTPRIDTELGERQTYAARGLA